MLAARFVACVLILGFASVSSAAAQPETRPVPTRPQRSRIPSLTPPLVVLALGGVMLLASGAVVGMGTGSSSCLDLLGEGCELDASGREPIPALRVVAGVGGGVLFVGLGWLLGRDHARRRWRTRQVRLEPVVRLGRDREPGSYGLMLRGSF